MSPNTTRRLLSLHRWCGILVSANLLVLSLTGLILIFHEEIDRALGVVPPARSGEPKIGVAEAIALARAAMPEAAAVSVSQESKDFPGLVFVGMSPSRKIADSRTVTVDLNAGAIAEATEVDDTFTSTVLKIHAQLYAGAFGQLLVGAVALAFLVSLISGALVYGPMMKRFAFGFFRQSHSRQTMLADLHKLIGAATFGWTLVVASTGLMLSFGSVLLQLYSTTELTSLAATSANSPVVEALETVDRALESAEASAPGKTWSFIALPGSDLASPRHYTVLLNGGTGLEARLMTMSMVDALEPGKAEAHELPWYLKLLLISEPLHFGNYGGLLLKLVWALFTVATLTLSGSGVWVFVKARHNRNGGGVSQTNDALVKGPEGEAA
jgi:uncharacterized iron-regulated membrane protein